MDKINTSVIVAGDVILYHGNSLLAKLIRFFDGTEVNHAAICIGNGIVGEALKKGLTARTLSESIKSADYVIVRRLKSNPGSMQPVVNKAEYYLSIGNRYGFEEIILLAFLGMTRKIQVNKYVSWLLRKILDQAANWLTASGDRQPMICSEFVYRSYDEALPASHDPYTLDIATFPVTDRGALFGARALATPQELKPYHRDSLLSWVEIVTAEQKLSRMDSYIHSLKAGLENSLAKAPSHDDESLAKMSLDELIENYLQEVQKPVSRSVDLEASLRSPEMFESISNFSKSYYTFTHHRKAMTLQNEEEADVPTALDYLIKTVADFVTPGDLYKCDTLSSIGKVTSS